MKIHFFLQKLFGIYLRVCHNLIGFKSSPKDDRVMKMTFVESKKDKNFTICNRGCPRGVMVKAMDCGIVVREFVLQSRYYIHFRANTLGKGMNPLILPAMG